MSRTILVVDDEKSVREAFVRCLAGVRAGLSRDASADAQPGLRETGGYRVLLAHSGEEAVRLVDEQQAAGRRVACGFFDLRLGAGMDGLETIRQVRGVDPDLLCTVVTGCEDRTVDDINDYFLPDHADEWDYLSKPFSRWEIRQKCRQMVESWNRRRREEAHVAEIQRLGRRHEEHRAALEERLRSGQTELDLQRAELEAGRTELEELQERLDRSRAELREARSSKRKGRRTPNWKVTEATACAIGALLAAGYTKATIARTMRLHRATVFKIAGELRATQGESASAQEALRELVGSA